MSRGLFRFPVFQVVEVVKPPIHRHGRVAQSGNGTWLLTTGWRNPPREFKSLPDRFGDAGGVRGVEHEIRNLEGWVQLPLPAPRQHSTCRLVRRSCKAGKRAQVPLLAFMPGCQSSERGWSQTSLSWVQVPVPAYDHSGSVAQREERQHGKLGMRVQLPPGPRGEVVKSGMAAVPNWSPKTTGEPLGAQAPREFESLPRRSRLYTAPACGWIDDEFGPAPATAKA